MGISLLLAAALAGCGASEYPQPEPEPAPEEPAPSLVAVSPASIKADHAGDLVLEGRDFVPGAIVLANGEPVVATFVDAKRIVVTRAPGDPLLPAVDLAFQVFQPGGLSDARTIEVRPVLADAAHLRTLPGLFLRNGGFLDLWVTASDSEDDFLAPGHRLAGADGLGHANFQWSDVTLTPVGSTTPITPDYAGVADVFFDPVGAAKPLSVSLAIDQSGSIVNNGGTDPNDERVTQAKAFVMRLSDMDEVEVLRFQGSNVSLVQGFTGDKAALTGALDSLKTGETGGTPLYDAVIRAVNDVAPKSARTRAAIVLTDGVDNGSNADAAEAIDAARAAGVPVFTIGLGNPNDAGSLDKAVLQRIADETGGRFLFAQDPTALGGVFEALTELLTDSYQLRCAVAFDPPLTTAGAYTIAGNVVVEVDGTRRVIPMAPLNVSIAP